LERVLDNLLHNATKAVPRSGGILEMQCFKADEMACLEILNSGEIPQDKVERVKRGFVVGRGLNIVSSFIHEHNGKLEITSENGMSTFMIKLPLCLFSP
ncbi:MAG: HAMP domain-containing histidine kinase, partial [Deltaproteobacteria bacterium]|nr:HAMP domain-containing histidine kinase [Deltaproteobacteria bacterium]